MALSFVKGLVYYVHNIKETWLMRKALIHNGHLQRCGFRRTTKRNRASQTENKNGENATFEQFQFWSTLETLNESFHKMAQKSSK